MSEKDTYSSAHWFGPLELVFLFGTFIVTYWAWRNALLSAGISTFVWGMVILGTYMFGRTKRSAKIEWRRIFDILHIWP